MNNKNFGSIVPNRARHFLFYTIILFILYCYFCQFKVNSPFLLEAKGSRGRVVLVLQQNPILRLLFPTPIQEGFQVYVG